MTEHAFIERGSRLRRLLAPPVFDDLDKTRAARLNVRMALTIGLVGTLVLLAIVGFLPSQSGRWLLVAAVLDGICILIIVITRRGFVVAAGWFQTVAAWALFTLTALTAGGVAAPSISVQLIVVVVAVMVLGRKAGFAVAALCIATVFGMALAQKAGVLPESRVVHTPWSRALTVSGAILIIAVLQSIIASNLRSARDRAVRELAERRAAELLSGTVIDSAPGFFYTLDAEGRFLRWNRRTVALTGVSPEGLRGKDVLEIVHEDDRELVDKMMAETSESGSAQTEARIMTPDGPRDHLLSGQRMVLEGAPVLVGFGVDVTQRRRLEEELRALSLHDDLTGLYNRRAFVTLADQQLKVARRMDRELVVAFMDVDGMKLLNDTCGHAAGDRALRAVANALRAGFRDADVVARIGGDEFVALVVEPGDVDGETLALRLNARLVEGAGAEGLPDALTLSVGMARFEPSRPVTLEELLARADAAMYRRKQRHSD